MISDTGASSDVSSAIFDAARDLDKPGVDLIVTSCGFLGELQKELEKQIATPVLSSALVLTPLVRSIFGARASTGCSRLTTVRNRKLEAKRTFCFCFDNTVYLSSKTGQDY